MFRWLFKRREDNPRAELERVIREGREARERNRQRKERQYGKA